MMVIQALVWYVDDSTAAAIRQWIWGDVAYSSYSKSYISMVGILLERNFSEY